MDGAIGGIICFLILLAAFLVYLHKDRTSHALVLQRLELYMGNNMELKKKITELEKSVSDQRQVMMAHALELKDLQDKCLSLSGRQAGLHKRLVDVKEQTKTTKIDFTVVSPEKRLLNKVKKQVQELSQ